MATITMRKRVNGSKTYKAHIRIKRQGKVIYSEARTFEEKSAAQLWVIKREKEVKAENSYTCIAAQTLPVPKAASIRELICLYENKVGKIKTWGRSKQYVLNAWKGREEGDFSVYDVDSRWLIDFCIKRKSEEGAAPATINADIAILRSVFSVSRDLLGVDVSITPFMEARPVMKKLGLVGKSQERDRRPEIDEISAIVELAYHARKRCFRAAKGAPLDKLIVFQMFSGRRISETCRIEWTDVDTQRQRVLIRDMKDPSNKEGNDVWVLIPNEAWRVLCSMPRIPDEKRVFPYNPKTVSTSFERMRAKAGFYNEHSDNNLKLHDLRHECLSWLAEKNGLNGESWDIPRIQMVSGHKNWNVLQRYVNMLSAEPVDRWKKWVWKEKVLK